MGATDLDGVSRLESLRDAAQQSGHCRARDAEHLFAVSAAAVFLTQRGRAACADRTAEGSVRRSSRPAPADWGRHHLPIGGGPGWKYSVADREPVFELRLGRRGRRLWIRPAESRRPVYLGRPSSERAGAAETALPYD